MGNGFRIPCGKCKRYDCRCERVVKEKDIAIASQVKHCEEAAFVLDACGYREDAQRMDAITATVQRYLDLTDPTPIDAEWLKSMKAEFEKHELYVPQHNGEFWWYQDARYINPEPKTRGDVRLLLMRLERDR